MRHKNNIIQIKIGRNQRRNRPTPGIRLNDVLTEQLSSAVDLGNSQYVKSSKRMTLGLQCPY